LLPWGIYEDFPHLARASCLSSAVVRLLGRECASLPSWELKRPMLGCMAGWLAKAPLSVRVLLITDGNLQFVALGLLHTILCMVLKQSLVRLFVWYKLQGPGHQFLYPVLSSSSLCKNDSTSLCLPHAHRSKPSRLVKDGSWRRPWKASL
jgi:hypothetical protein